MTNQPTSQPSPYDHLVNQLFAPIAGQEYLYGGLPLAGFYIYRGITSASPQGKVNIHLFTQAGYTVRDIQHMNQQYQAQKNRHELGLDPHINLQFVDRVLAVQVIIDDPLTDPVHKVFETCGLRLVNPTISKE